jgi:hypothetical protein
MRKKKSAGDSGGKHKETSTAITLETHVDELVGKYPKAAGWLVQHGVICVVCGEPFWGTLGELMERKGIGDPDKIVKNLNRFLARCLT